MTKKIIKINASIFIPLILLSLIFFFFVDMKYITGDFDKKIGIKYDDISEQATVTSTLAGYLIKDETGTHFATPYISGKIERIKLFKTENNKYYIVFNSSFSNNTKADIYKKLNNYYVKKQNNNIITIDKIRTFYEVPANEVEYYGGERNYDYIIAPNLTYGKFETSDFIVFEEIETNNGYDVEIYHDNKNTYYILTKYKRNDLRYLIDGNIIYPIKESEENIVLENE